MKKCEKFIRFETAYENLTKVERPVHCGDIVPACDRDCDENDFCETTAFCEECLKANRARYPQGWRRVPGDVDEYGCY